jgi:dihydroflavonol-4-reductase
MARVLVTGASGFIGPHLVAALVARGDEVSCLVQKTSAVDRLEQHGVKLYVGDVTEEASLEAPIAGAEIVYHLAGRNQVFRSREFYQVNQEGGRNVAAVCARQSVPPVLVWLSSLAAAGPAKDDRLRTEADPLVQVAHYGRSKRLGEEAAEDYAGAVPITIVRSPMAFGEADHQTLPMFKSIAQAGIHIVPGLGRARFSVIYVGDLVDLLILAAERGTRLKPDDHGAKPDGYYFAACEEHPSYAELGRMIGAALGRRRVLVVPTIPQTIWLFALGGEVISRIQRRPFSLNIDKAREIRAGSWTCSPQRAREELGFSVAVPFADRLRQIAEWYRENGWL